MIRLPLAVCLAVVVAFPMQAVAAGVKDDVPFPRFDTRSYCEITALRSDGAYTVGDCIQDEEFSALDVSSQWDWLPEQLRAACKNIALASGKSYFVLGACLSHYDLGFMRSTGRGREVDRASAISRGFLRR